MIPSPLAVNKCHEEIACEFILNGVSENMSNANPIKSLIFHYIIYFYNLLHLHFRLKYTYLNDKLLTISKLQTASFYHKNYRSYKLLNMTTPDKTVCTVRTLFI